MRCSFAHDLCPKGLQLRDHAPVVAVELEASHQCSKLSRASSHWLNVRCAITSRPGETGVLLVTSLSSWTRRDRRSASICSVTTLFAHDPLRHDPLRPLYASRCLSCISLPISRGNPRKPPVGVPRSSSYDWNRSIAWPSVGRPRAGAAGRSSRYRIIRTAAALAEVEKQLATLPAARLCRRSAAAYQVRLPACRRAKRSFCMAAIAPKALPSTGPTISATSSAYSCRWRWC